MRSKITGFVFEFVTSRGGGRAIALTMRARGEYVTVTIESSADALELGAALTKAGEDLRLLEAGVAETKEKG